MLGDAGSIAKLWGYILGVSRVNGKEIKWNNTIM